MIEKKQLYFFGGLLLSLFLVMQGCNSQECKANKDCDKGSFCSRGKCVFDCASAKDCKAGQTCSSRGKCVDGEPPEKTGPTEETVPNKEDGGVQPTTCSNGETKRCFEADQALLGVGVCGQGLQTCSNGSWGPCVGQILPSKEVCDKKDNDCDGKTDEELTGCGCAGNADCPASKPNCQAGICIKFCKDNSECPSNESCKQGYCQPCADGGDRTKQEVCNGKDDNCNGQADEGSCPAGQSCNPTTLKCEGGQTDCTKTGCTGNQVCNTVTKKCENKGGCVKGSCPPNSKCNEQTGQCEKVDPCSGITCPQGQVCDKNTGQCKSNGTDCTQTGCPNGQKCNTTTKKCEQIDLCKGVTCGQGQVCDKKTGQCISNGTDCTQTGCSAGYQCNTTTKKCEKMDLCKGITCGQGQTCDPNDGLCKTPNCNQTGCPAGQRCNVGTGLCEKWCSADTDCATGEYCETGTGQCKKGCRSTSDCNMSGVVCTQGKCVSTYISGRCTSSNDCSSGYHCVTLDPNGSVSHCVLECTGNSSTCNPSSSCTALSTGTSVCLTYANKGESCGVAKGVLCKRNQDPLLYCSPSSGKCAEAQVQGNEGDPCSSTSSNDDPPKVCDAKKSLICDETTLKCKKAVVVAKHEQCGTNDKICDQNKKERCITMDQGVNHGYCLSPCTGTNDANCNGRCVELTDGSYVCVEAGTKKEDEICGGRSQNATKLDVTQDCVKGYVCLRLTNTNEKGVCSSYGANGCSSLTCKSGFQCLSLTGGAGACVKDCSSDPKLCKTPGTTCEDITGFGKFCAPEPVYGPKKYGELCNPSGNAAIEGCSKGNICLATDQNRTKGFCSVDCTSTQTCSSVTNSSGQSVPAQCSNLGGSASYCLFTCAQSGPCPNSMTCQTVTQGDICIP